MAEGGGGGEGALIDRDEAEGESASKAPTDGNPAGCRRSCKRTVIAMATNWTMSASSTMLGRTPYAVPPKAGMQWEKIPTG